MCSGHPFYRSTSGYPERIQRLKHLVQILLTRTEPAQPIYLSASGPHVLLVGVSIYITLCLASGLLYLAKPTSLELITHQISHLRTYSHFSVPGTTLLNILIGAIYPIWIAAPLSCLLTALGSTTTYLLIRTARPLFVRFIPRPLILIQRAFNPFRLKGSPEIASYILISGPLPIFPYAALNLASSILKHPILSFFWNILIRSLP
ncbi:hypothetical protein PTTG_10925 [Puccinia triticina 1-1 BBBD Race 1]|uniref:Golgi apparatus membrane protein TVP38 n=1 Tax=Puccinia triticina (isolate 1-1 / race 1 (BBBD)) TaxID=630390 RepID=A0A180GV80_PUCT1|nr:hypothetical protein PTTG_10925 [Puccinia triticina 1-1 BBBD Race 1]